VKILPEDIINVQAGGGKKDQSPIGPGDDLAIAVKELPDLDQEVMVSDKGQIELKLLGTMNILGQTTGDVEERIAAFLESTILKIAHVTVLVKNKTRG
jgi:protein involved in polysaccharide export with SLBB domain